MRFKILFLFMGAVIVACSTGNTASPCDDADGTCRETDPTEGTLPPASSPAATNDWAALYTQYFGAGTQGHCGNCHADAKKGFKCGTTAETCFQGLVDAELLDLAVPATSRLGNPAETPLSWFGGDRPMPLDDAHEDTVAAAAVTAWLKAGAPFAARSRPLEDASAPITDAGPMKDGGPKPPDGGTDAGKDASPLDAGSDASVPVAAPTWTTIYATYFAAGTPGHCGNSGCHQTIRSGFKCGTTKATCFQGLVTKGLVTPAAAATSPLGDANQTPLAWFGTGGGMPKDQAVKNTAAAKAVTAWLVAGALNN